MRSPAPSPMPNPEPADDLKTVIIIELKYSSRRTYQNNEDDL